MKITLPHLIICLPFAYVVRPTQCKFSVFSLCFLCPIKSWPTFHSSVFLFVPSVGTIVQMLLLTTWFSWKYSNYDLDQFNRTLLGEQKFRIRKNIPPLKLNGPEEWRQIKNIMIVVKHSNKPSTLLLLECPKYLENSKNSNKSKKKKTEKFDFKSKEILSHTE